MTHEPHAAPVTSPAAPTPPPSAPPLGPTGPAPAARRRLGRLLGLAPLTAPRRPTHLQPGRVLRADRGACEVLLDDRPADRRRGGRDLRRAVEDDPVETPAAGDWVLVDRGDPGAGTDPTVHEVLPRRTAVVRLQVGKGSHGQVLAANADVVAVVEGLDPDPDTGRIERLLALAWASGATPGWSS